jgi:hypothetical protein
MEELNTPIFAQAKVEYTAQLVDILYTHMFDGVKSIYEESKLIYSSRQGMPILLVFRELLEKVPIWNSEIIDSECSRIVNNSNCDWIDDLITAVFISHTKILTSIGPNQSFQKINITIPKTSTFIHKSYINAARELWKNPYLFNENVPGHEFQKNNKEIENIIRKCIENTIRNLLPIKEILKEHLEGETDSILNQKETLKQLLRDELKNISTKQKIVKDHNDESTEDEATDNEAAGNEVFEDEVDEVDEFVEDEVADGKENVTTNNTLDNGEDNDMSPTIIKEDTSDENVLPLLNDKLRLINEKESQLMNELNQINEKFPISDDPTDEQVESKCSDIVVNDITIPVDIPTDIPKESNTPPVVEIKYDNVDLVGTTDKPDLPVNQDRLKRLMTNMEVKEEVSVVKSEEIAAPINDVNISVPTIQEPIKPSFSLNTLYPNMNNTTDKVKDIVTNNVVTPLQIIKEDNPVTINEPKSPRKDMVMVKNEDDIDETSSLANFFDDMKKIVEEKGIKVETNNDKSYSLFEDAPFIEK